MTKYYVSSLGNDSNDGLSTATPWATIGKVNSSSSLFKAGDSILFRSSDIFYGTLILPVAIANTGLLTISSYGFGRKPKISGYKVANNVAGWVNHATNVWKIDLTNVSSFTGNTANTTAETGFIKVNGVIYGNKKWSLANLAVQWDFYNDSQYLYVYSTANPTSLASDIQIAPKGDLITLRNSLLISGLEFLGTGSHALNGSPVNNKIINNDIHEIGGAMLSGTNRYGNGIQVWSQSKDTLIENNNIYDVYDVAYTMQGNLDALAVGYKGFENVVYRNNTDWNCTQSFEVWSEYSGNPSVPNTGFYNCVYELNTSLNVGRGWGYNVRPDQNVAVALLMYHMYATNIDITVRNNTFYNPRALYYISNIDIPSGYNTKNNQVFMSSGTLINTQLSYTVEQSSQFQTAKNKEIGSSFLILPTQNNTVPLTISSLLGLNALNASQVKDLQMMVSRLNGKIEQMLADGTMFPLYGTSSPTVIPNYIGQTYVDTTKKIVYKATGTSTSADWTRVRVNGDDRLAINSVPPSNAVTAGNYTFLGQMYYMEVSPGDPNIASYPSSVGGLLITYRGLASDVYSYQHFVVRQSNSVYSRYWDGTNLVWTAWVKISAL